MFFTHMLRILTPVNTRLVRHPSTVVQYTAPVYCGTGLLCDPTTVS